MCVCVCLDVCVCVNITGVFTWHDSVKFLCRIFFWINKCVRISGKQNNVMWKMKCLFEKNFLFHSSLSHTLFISIRIHKNWWTKETNKQTKKLILYSDGLYSHRLFAFVFVFSNIEKWECPFFSIPSTGI